jgi:hypothetical protein
MTSNVIMPGADAMVFGKGNTVTAGTRGVVVGDGQTLSGDGMVVNNLTVTGSINGDVVVPYKKYIANITQSGIAAPTVSILENTIGDIVWTRNLAGEYYGTLTNAFPMDKTYIIINAFSNNASDSAAALWNNVSQVAILTCDTSFTRVDNILSFTTIEIRTY